MSSEFKENAAGALTEDMKLRMQALLDTVSTEEAEAAERDFKRFLSGEISWAQFHGLTPKMLCEMAQIGYLKFKSGRLDQAAAIFRGLMSIDPNSSYYHTALGAVYQKQQRYFDAIMQYTLAVEMDPKDIVAHVNRSEVYFNSGYDQLPFEDLEAAIALDPESKDPWGNRARLLKKQYQEFLDTCVPA